MEKIVAKFNIEVELDWLDEDGAIDEVLKNEIIDTVTSKVAAQTVAGIDKQLDKIIQTQSEKAEQLVSERLNDMLEDFMTRPRTITDQWGDVKKTNISVVDMLKEACDNFIEGKVDEQGRDAKHSYGKTMPRIQYVISKQIDYKMEKGIESAAKQIKEGLQKYIDDTLKAQIGESVAKIIGLDKIVEKL